MKLTGKTLSTFTLVLLLCLFIGTLLWEVLARILLGGGLAIDLSVGPYGFDLGVVSLHVRANPGTLLGLPGALLLFRSL